MAIIGNIAIGMSVGSGGFKKGLNSARGSLESFGNSVMSIQGLVAGALGGAAAAGVYKMASQFAHLAEASSKVEAVFGSQAEGVKASAQAMADAYGMSLTDIYDKQSMMGAMLTGVGFNDKAAANYADVFTRLANDMTRRWDVKGGMTVALDQIMAGLRGSGDALEKYGVTMNEETVKARAYQMGLARVGQELSEGAKKQARANIILEQMRSSIGGASGEVGSFGANVEALSGRWENFATTMGEVFAPALGSAFGGLGDLLKWLQDSWTANKQAVFSWAGGAAESIGFTVDGVDVLSTAIGGIGSAWDAVGMGFKFVQGYITDGLATLVDGLATLARSFDWILEKMGQAGTGMSGFLEAYADELRSLSKEQHKAFQEAVAGPDAGALMQASLQRTRDGIRAMQAELAAKSMDLVKNVGASGVATKLVREGKPYGEAVRAGSAEAARSMARARLGSGSNSVEKTSKQTADNTKRSVVVQQKMATAIDAMLDKYKVATVVSM